MLKKALKILAYAMLSVAVFIGYAFWAEESEIYRCEGQGRYSQSFVDQYQPQMGSMENPYVDEVGFLKIESFTKISLLWTNGRHYIWWEKPNASIDLWTNVTEVGDQLQLNNYDGNLEGVFSQISRSLSFVTGTREFEGMCKKVEQ
jgi:hypothetical protein